MQVKRVRCESSGVLVAKDKVQALSLCWSRQFLVLCGKRACVQAIKRFLVRNIVDASAIRDIQDSSLIDGELAEYGAAAR